MTLSKFFLFTTLSFFQNTFSQNQLFESLEQTSLPAGASSGHPFVFADSSGGVLVSWVESLGGKRHALMFSRLTGSMWSTPKTVVSGDDFFVNWADVPSIVKISDGTLACHWLRRSAGSPYSYDVNVVVSRDDGLSWSKPVKPHSDTTKTEHGFASFFEAEDKTAGLVWLDGRKMTSENYDHGGGNMTLRTVTIDREARLGAEIELDDRVCECCPTAATATKNALIVAYRNRSEDEVRDIYILRSVAGTWSKPFPVRSDGWQIPGCPVNGPALSSRGRDVAVAWFTAADGKACVFLAFSHDEGASFGTTIRVDEGRPLGRVALAMLPDKSVLVLWIEYREDGGELLVRRVWSNEKKSDHAKIASISAERASGYPRIAFARDRVVLAWTDVDPEKKVKVAIGVLR